MRIVVQKYGGSSVADVEKIRVVAERVVATKQQGFAVVVVVSAMGKTTDQLLARAREISVSPSRTVVVKVPASTWSLWRTCTLTVAALPLPLLFVTVA